MTKYDILIVEDNKGILESLSELFDLNGFTVSTAIDGYDALEKLKEGIRPCWIVLDLTMPRMGGLECLGHIRSHPDWKDIPITLLSAAGRITDEATEHKVDYLKKPIEIDTLFAMARKHCG